MRSAITRPFGLMPPERRDTGGARESATFRDEVVNKAVQLAVGEWQLFYEADFANASPTSDIRDFSVPALVNTLGLQPMELIWTPNLDVPGATPPKVERMPNGSVRLTVEKPPTADPDTFAGVALVVRGFPDAKADLFALQASFKYPTGPSEPIGRSDESYAWSHVLFAGKESYVQATPRRITVTLQANFDDTRGAPGAFLNTPGGAPTIGGCPPPPNVPKPGFIPNAAYKAIYESNFTSNLECYVDRGLDKGIATFWTLMPGNPLRYSETRTFCNPFIKRTSSSDPIVQNVIDVAGLGLAIFRGVGPARVELHSFRVYRLVYPRSIRVSSILGALSRRSSVLRKLREGLMKRAFERLPRELPSGDG